MVQDEFKAAGLKSWQLVAEGGELSRQDVVEGMSKLMQAVYAREYRKMKLPEAVRRFMAIAEALCAKVADMIGLGAAYRKAAEQGKVDLEFDEFVSRVTREDLLAYEGNRAEESARKEFEESRKRIRDEDTHFALATLAGETEAWRRELGDYLSGDNSKRTRDMRVCTTPAVLRALGARPHDLVMTPGVVDKVMAGKHSVSREAMEQLPQAVSEPIAVFDSVTSSNSLVVLTELREAGNNVIVAVHLDSRSSEAAHTVSVNRIMSLYGKENARALLNTPMRYLDIKKARPWLVSHGLQLPGQAVRKGSSGKLLKPADIVKWKEAHGAGFAMSTKGVMDEMRRKLEAARAMAVRDYWSLVISRVEAEERFLRELRMSGDIDESRIRVMQARGVIRAAVGELPAKARIGIEGYEEMISMCLDALAHGEWKANRRFSAEDLERLNRRFRGNPGLLHEFIGEEVGKVLERVVKRCGEVINLHVRDELFGQMKEMLKSMSPAVDADTRKFKVGTIGADNVRYVRKIGRMILSTQKNALAEIENLKGRIEAIEMERRAREANPDLSAAEADEDLLAEKEVLMREYLMWEQYGACGSRDVNAAMKAHGALFAFMMAAQDAWSSNLKEKVGRWDDVSAKLAMSLPEEETEIARHDAMLDFKGNNMDGTTRRRTARDLMMWLESPVQFMRRLARKPGSQWYFEKKLRDLVKIQDTIDAMQMDVRGSVRKELMRITKSRNEADLNRWLAAWNEEHVSDVKLKPVKSVEMRIDMDKAQEILEKRKKNPWYGYRVYSQESIDALQVEYDEWLAGRNKARKWFTIEKWEELPPQGLKVSRDQALYILMSLGQKSAFHNLRKKGYDEEVEAALWDYVGDEGREIAELLFKQYYDAGQRVKDGYEDRYGVPWSGNERYSPLCWIKVEGVSDHELNALVGESNGIGTARTDGFLSVREKHNRNLDTTVGALRLFWSHVALTDNWAYSQKFLEDMRGELRKPRIAQHLMVNIGGQEYKKLLGVLNNLEHAGARKVEAYSMMSDRLQAVQNANAVGVLAGQITSLLKQTSGIFNALLGCDLSIADWVKGMARVVGGRAVMSPKDLFSSDLFQARKDGYAFSVLQGYKRELGGRFGIVERMVNRNMNSLGWLDAGTNAVSFAAAFDHYYREAVKLGGSHESALQVAAERIEVGMSEASQPVNWLQRANVLNDYGPTTRANFFLMSETVNKAALVLSQASRGDWRRALRSHLLIGTSMQMIGYLVDCMMKNGDDDDKWPDPLEYVPGILFGAFNGVPVLGELLSWPVNKVLDELGFEKKMQTGGAGKLLFDKRSFSMLADLLEGDLPDNSRDARAMSTAGSNVATAMAMADAFTNPRGGMVLSMTLGLAAVCNYLKYIFGFTEKVERWEYEREAEEGRRAHAAQ